MGSQHVDSDHSFDFFLHRQPIDKSLNGGSSAGFPEIDDTPIHQAMVQDLSCALKIEEEKAADKSIHQATAGRIERLAGRMRGFARGEEGGGFGAGTLCFVKSPAYPRYTGSGRVKNACRM